MIIVVNTDINEIRVPGDVAMVYERRWKSSLLAATHKHRFGDILDNWSGSLAGKSVDRISVKLFFPYLFYDGARLSSALSLPVCSNLMLF